MLFVAFASCVLASSGLRPSERVLEHDLTSLGKPKESVQAQTHANTNVSLSIHSSSALIPFQSSLPLFIDSDSTKSWPSSRVEDSPHLSTHMQASALLQSPGEGQAKRDMQSETSDIQYVVVGQEAQKLNLQGSEEEEVRIEGFSGGEVAALEHVSRERAIKLSCTPKQGALSLINVGAGAKAGLVLGCTVSAAAPVALATTVVGMGGAAVGAYDAGRGLTKEESDITACERAKHGLTITFASAGLATGGVGLACALVLACPPCGVAAGITSIVAGGLAVANRHVTVGEQTAWCEAMRRQFGSTLKDILESEKMLDAITQVAYEDSMKRGEENSAIQELMYASADFQAAIDQVWFEDSVTKGVTGAILDEAASRFVEAGGTSS